MTFFKRLFSPVQKPVVVALRGVAPEETLAAQGAMREQMEAQVAADRVRRAASDARPGTVGSARETPGEASTGNP